MKTEVALQLILCVLCQTLPQNPKSVPGPVAVDCVWSNWSEWSSCDPCTKSMRRSRSILAFGQFGGSPCQGSIGHRQFCQTAEVCLQPTPRPCTTSEFQCATGLKTCIKKRLLCNGDYDCEDGSDEDCDPGRKPCGSTQLENNEQGRTAGYGVNILGADPRMNPFNNDYFNGRCDRVRNPSTGEYDRLPWNVGVLNYETKVEEVTSREIFEDTNSVLQEMLKESTSSFSVGFSFKFSLSEEPLANTSATVDATNTFSKKEVIKNVIEYSEIKNKSFMRVKGKVQMSTYRMRSRELSLGEDFLAHVNSLPLQYDKGIYFAFLEDYGTHYTKTGRSGGEYELIYVLNQNTIKEKNITQRSLQNCFKLGVSVNTALGKIDINKDKNPGNCDISGANNTVTADGKALVDEVMTSVKGGTLESAVTMRAKLNREGTMDLATYQNWARTIANAPALIYSEPEPIYTLVPLDSPYANIRVSNLQRSIEDYVAEYNVCKCKPCQNGGTLALLDGKCICMCTGLFEGLACENYKGDKAKYQGQRPTVMQEGNWSCWSAWSTCAAGKHTRTRTCNTSGISGSATCRGDTSSEEYC